MSLPEDYKQNKSPGSNAFSRRRLVGTGAALSVGIVATTRPETSSSLRMRLLQYTADESNWPSEGQNLKVTRYVTKSAINSATIDKLGVAWNVPISIGAPYGSLVANPMIANGILFQQDAQSNVYALNEETGEKVWTNIYNDAVPSGGPNGVGLGYDMASFTLGGSAIVFARSRTPARKSGARTSRVIATKASRWVRLCSTAPFS